MTALILTGAGPCPAPGIFAIEAPMSASSIIPPDGRDNPSAWGKRWISAALATAGFAIAGYLALYQSQVIASVWEPFFGSGSAQVLHSRISNLLSIPDAAIGAAIYLLEAGAALIGGRFRWRTRSGAVTTYAGRSGLLSIERIVPVLCQTFVVRSRVRSVWHWRQFLLRSLALQVVNSARRLALGR